MESSLSSAPEQYPSRRTVQEEKVKGKGKQPQSAIYAWQQFVIKAA
jgi:hypothetical protein